MTEQQPRISQKVIDHVKRVRESGDQFNTALEKLLGIRDADYVRPAYSRWWQMGHPLPP